MGEAVDYFSNHRNKLRFPWRLYHQPIVRELSSALAASVGSEVLNLGSGPFFELSELPTLRKRFTLCDIDPRALALARELLGNYIVLMQQNGVINPPRQSHTQLSYHRDLPYQHFVSSRPLAIGALFCIDPFRVENGATVVIPASHRMEAFPSPEVAAQLSTPVTAEPGSFLVFDAMLFHRGGANLSDGPRRAVNHVFSVPIIAQQISLPDALGGRYADDPELSRLFGYESAPSPSVLAWRERRLARIRKQKP